MVAKRNKRKRSAVENEEHERQRQALLSRQSVLSPGSDEVPLVRCESAEVAHLIKRPLDGKAVEDSRRAPYMRLANFSCVRIGDFARQSYRMTMEHFWRLYDLLEPFMSPEPLPAPKDTENWNQPLRIKAALRFFAGGDPVDIASDHSIPSLWLLEEYIYDVVAAINECQALAIAFPESHDEQREIAAGFELFKSDIGITECCGALGGMMLLTELPRTDEDREKYFNERIGTWGLNMQAVCDHNGRFLEVDLDSPASSSDDKAYSESCFRAKLERPGFIADGLTLFSHGFYTDSNIITLPPHPTNVDPKYKEVYHRQLRDQVDGAFSGLLQRWALLRRPLPLSLGEQKIKQLVLAICKLQNFCLDDTELMPPLLAGDVVFGILNGAVLLDRDFRPARLLGVGEYRDDVIDC